MRTDTIESYLHSLADRVPAPGGGATAGLHAAQSAALLGMVARYSDGEKYAEHAAAIATIREAADELMQLAMLFAEDDATAFGAVGEAYGMPRGTEEQKAARSLAISAALVDAGRVPARVVTLAGQLIGLAERLLPIGNRNVISDVAAAADAARAAASTARVNVEINLAGITAADARAELFAAIAPVDDFAARAEKVTATVREVIAR